MDDDNQQQWVAEVGDREEYEHRGALHYMQRMRSDVDRLLEKWEAERPRLIALQQQLAAEKAGNSTQR